MGIKSLEIQIPWGFDSHEIGFQIKSFGNIFVYSHRNHNPWAQNPLGIKSHGNHFLFPWKSDPVGIESLGNQIPWELHPFWVKSLGIQFANILFPWESDPLGIKPPGIQIPREHFFPMGIRSLGNQISWHPKSLGNIFLIPWESDPLKLKSLDIQIPWEKNLFPWASNLHSPTAVSSFICTPQLQSLYCRP